MVWYEDPIQFSIVVFLLFGLGYIFVYIVRRLL